MSAIACGRSQHAAVVVTDGADAVGIAVPPGAATLAARALAFLLCAGGEGAGSVLPLLQLGA